MTPPIEQDVVGRQVEVLFLPFAALSYGGDARLAPLIADLLHVEHGADLQFIAVRHGHHLVDLEQSNPLSSLKHGNLPLKAPSSN